MQIHCQRCRAPQAASERHCLKCGAPFGGELWVLITGVLLAVFLPAMIATSGDMTSLLDARLVFWYELPVLAGTAFLYDHDPKRRSLYFWGGAVLIGGSMIVLLS